MSSYRYQKTKTSKCLSITWHIGVICKDTITTQPCNRDVSHSLPKVRTDTAYVRSIYETTKTETLSILLRDRLTLLVFMRASTSPCRACRMHYANSTSASYTISPDCRPHSPPGDQCSTSTCESYLLYYICHLRYTNR